MASTEQILIDWVTTFNERRWEDARALYAEDARHEEIGTGRSMNVTEAIEAVKAWAHAFPDAAGSIDDAIASGDRIVGEIVWRGTHRGTMSGLPATGRPVEIQAAVVIEVRDGKIAFVRHYIDFAGILRQLGVLP